MNKLKTFELNYDDIRACNLFRASNDVRFYLCGIYVGAGAVVATNGHCLLVCDNPEIKDIELIIPAETIVSLIRKVGTNKRVREAKVSLHQLEDDYWLLECFGSMEIFKGVEGKYPMWQKVDIEKPEVYKCESFPQFNFNYLSDFQKVFYIYSLGKYGSPSIFPTGNANERCYIEINERVHGIIMPMRT